MDAMYYVTYPWYSNRDNKKNRHAKTSARPTIPVTCREGDRDEGAE